MSYTRQYHEVVHGSKTVHYGPSKDGGSKTVSIEIPVTVNIHVDTVPFDSSVRNAEFNIDLLTGAVVATEGAAITAKRKNANKVGDAIINGFFNYVKSEISQQISEITQQTDAMLMHIRGLSDNCITKKEQMLSDYKRISGRYMRLFTDLNRELSTRIHQLDQRAFLFKELTSELDARCKGSSAVSTIMVFNSENSDVQVKLSSALAKQQAASAMKKITAFLAQQKQGETAIRHCMHDDNHALKMYLPVCLVEMKANVNLTAKKCFIPDALAAGQQELIYAYPMTATWSPLKGENLRQLNFFFNKELNARMPAGIEETGRIRNMIQNLANLDKIQATS